MAELLPIVAVVAVKMSCNDAFNGCFNVTTTPTRNIYAKTSGEPRADPCRFLLLLFHYSTSSYRGAKAISACPLLAAPCRRPKQVAAAQAGLAAIIFACNNFCGARQGQDSWALRANS